MPDSLRRAIRTFVQAFVGTLAVLAIPALTDLVRSISSAEPYEIDFRFWQGVVIAACASGVIARAEGDAERRRQPGDARPRHVDALPKIRPGVRYTPGNGSEAASCLPLAGDDRPATVYLNTETHF
jgi:hypothetical protein